MQFIKLSASKTESNFHLIEFDVKKEPLSSEVVGDYNFYILYSKDPATGFNRIQENKVDVIIDGAVGPLSYTHKIKQYDFGRESYYKIQMILKADPENITLSKIFYTGNTFLGYHDSMRYVEEVLTDVYIGSPAYILKKNTDGARCPECWSPHRQQRIKTYCYTCNGSGFLHGFYEPIKIQVAIESGFKNNEPKMTGETVTNTIRAIMTNYPLVRASDLIYMIEDARRFVIQKVDYTKLPNFSKERRGLSMGSEQDYIVSQILTLVELVASDPEYNIPVTVPIDINEMSDLEKAIYLGGGVSVLIQAPLDIKNNILYLRYDQMQMLVNAQKELALKYGGGALGDTYETFTCSSGQIVFTLTYSPAKPETVEMVISGGLELINGDDYTVVDRIITYLGVTPLSLNDVVMFHYIKNV